MSPLNVVVIGTGMYVCGRGTSQYGTILPALCEWARTRPVGSVYVAGASLEGVHAAQTNIHALQQRTGVELSLRYFPERKPDPRCYREAMQQIPRPACAIVAVPDHLHREIAGAALEEGLHTLVVKPLVPTVKAAQELIELQQRHQRYGAVEFHKRLDRANLTLKDTVAEGRLGDPLYVLVEYSQRKGIPAKQFRKWVLLTNSFQYLGVHYVDIIYVATQALPRRVMAVGQQGWLVAQGVEAYDAIEAVVEWELPSGRRFSAQILTNWIDPECTSAMSDQKITVVGTKGRFESDQKRRGITVVSDEHGIEEPNPDFCAAYGQDGRLTYHGYGIDSLHQFLQDVVEIEGGRWQIAELEERRPTFRQAVVSTAVVEAVNMSLAQNGKWVTIPEGTWELLQPLSRLIV